MAAHSRDRIESPPAVKIVALSGLNAMEHARAAAILRESIAGPAYRAPGAAEEELRSFLRAPDRFALAAIGSGRLRGWIGGIRSYSHALELHPLVVEAEWRRKGVGRELVAALEAKARALRLLTIYVGTDDESGGTNLFGKELFPDPLTALGKIRPSRKGHPYFFYSKLGFVPAGIIPDANGPGMPDLFLVKKLEAGG